MPNAKITASNALVAHIVKALLEHGSPLDNCGIGERLITSSSSPVLSGVYKMSELENNGKWKPKIKISNSREKITLPGNKQVYRLYKKDEPNKAFADVIALIGEQIGDTISAVNADVYATCDKVELKDFVAKPLLSEILTPDHEKDIESDTFAIQKFAHQKIAELPTATKRQIDMSREGGSLMLRIRDDGRGIEPGDMNKPKSFGLRGMRERMASLGGSARIGRCAAGGTEVVLRAPLLPESTSEPLQ